MGNQNKSFFEKKKEKILFCEENCTDLLNMKSKSL